MYFKLALGLVALSAYAFQVYLKDIVWLSYGIGKTVEPLSNFNYTCRAIRDERLNGCEDLILSESTRQLILACGDSRAKGYWQPSMGALNAKKRSTKDAIVIMNIDSPKGDSFEYRTLSTAGYDGPAGDGLLQLNGFDVEEDGKGGARILLVNNRPAVDPATGQIQAKQTKGHNGTVEEFFIKDLRKSKEMRHVRTFASPLIASPNRPAGTGDGGFYVTNDHGLNVPGLRRDLSMFTGDGTVTFCHPKEGCKTVATNLHFPNGLVRDAKTGLLYVPSSALGYIRVYQPREDHSLEQIDEVHMGYGLDNLAIAPSGDIHMAAFPASSGIARKNANPARSPATTMLKLSRGEHGWLGAKVIEDVNSNLLPAATTALRDEKTGRLFLGGVISPFITVCEEK